MFTSQSTTCGTMTACLWAGSGHRSISATSTIGKMGLVGIWDAIAFDEVADLQKMPKEIITMLKTYGESGTFARGKVPCPAWHRLLYSATPIGRSR
jgi:hypothetical protein